MSAVNIHNQTCDEREFCVGDKEVKQIIPTYMYMCDRSLMRATYCDKYAFKQQTILFCSFIWWLGGSNMLVNRPSTFWWLLNDCMDLVSAMTMIRYYGIIYRVIYVPLFTFIWSFEYLVVSQDLCKIYILWNHL